MADKVKKGSPLIDALKYKRSLSGSDLSKCEFSELGLTIYWGPAPSSIHAQYAADLVQQNYAKAYPKMIYFRAVDKDGERLFTKESELDKLYNEVDFSFIMRVGNMMIADDKEQLTMEAATATAGKR